MAIIHHPTEFLPIVQSEAEFVVFERPDEVKPKETVRAELRLGDGNVHAGPFAIRAVYLNKNLTLATFTTGTTPRCVEFDTPDESTQIGFVANPLRLSVRQNVPVFGISMEHDREGRMCQSERYTHFLEFLDTQLVLATSPA